MLDADGYDTIVVNRPEVARLNQLSVLVRHARAAVRSITTPPVLLGHGLGAIAVLRRLERGARRRHADAVSDHQVFPGRGHALVTDSGWEDVAGFVLDWLSRPNL